MKIWVPGDPVPEEITEFSFFDWVTDTIAVTSYARASSREVLDVENVEYVISIGSLSPDRNLIGRDVVRAPNIEDATMDIGDGDILECVEAIIKHSKMGKTLVHCAAGVSRSPGFVMLALCLDRKWDWSHAKAYVVERRPVSDVHPVLEIRLTKWLDEYRKTPR